MICPESQNPNAKDYKKEPLYYVTKDYCDSFLHGAGCINKDTCYVYKTLLYPQKIEEKKDNSQITEEVI